MSNSTNYTRKVIILGAGGYLGSALCEFFDAMPHCHVLAVFRKTPNHAFFNDYLMTDVFAESWSKQIAREMAVLINCAFDFEAVGRGTVEKKFAVLEANIASLCQQGPIKLINISTMSAYSNCRSDYGREKLYVENLFRKYGGLNVRPGLIASWHRPGAAFLNLINIVKRSKIIPNLTARNSGFYYSDLEAVLLGINLLSHMKLNKPHTISFCYQKRLSLFATLRVIEDRFEISRLKIQIPWRLAYFVLRTKEALFGKSKLRADSIVDFAHPARTAFRREYFARLIEYFYDDLESISQISQKSGGFYFLEGEKRRRRQSPCNKSKIDDGAIVVLGQLSDTNGIR